MPRVPLLDLLGEREIVHPSTVKKIAYSNGALEIDICGYPWWLPKRKAQQMCDSHALIEFRDISHANLTESVLHNDSLAEDLEEFKRIYNMDLICTYVLSPVYGQIEPKELVQFVKDNMFENTMVQVQLHKIIWNPDERGV